MSGSRPPPPEHPAWSSCSDLDHDDDEIELERSPQEVMLRALEDLITQVRDPRSREQLMDAVRAYQSGALRACVITTWVAVALDLTAKIRELADGGDAAATAWTTSLDIAIANNDIAKLGKIEQDLLDESRDTFEFIGAREHEELTRLQRDRHVCAHPAFVRPEDVFAPTPEACRAHLTVAVDAVLSQPPTPGRKAIDRFIQEARGYAWPARHDALAAHLRAVYFERGRPTLRRSLLQVIVKGCLNAPDGDPQLRSRMIDAAHAVDLIAPTELEAAVHDVVRRREDTSGLTDQELLNLIGGLGDLPATWQALPQTSHPRAVALVSSAPLDELVLADVVRAEIAEATVASAVRDRLVGLDASYLRSVVERQPSRVLVPFALEQLDEAGSWRSAEDRMYGLVLPLAAYLDTDDVQRIHETLRSNGQVREASAIPPAVETLFDQTSDLPGALELWQKVSMWLQAHGRNGDPADYYAYPGLAAKVAAKLGA